MRTLNLSRSGSNKIRSHQTELKTSDVEDSLKPIPPGEWCVLSYENSRWLGFVNPLVDEKFASVQVLGPLAGPAPAPEDFLRQKLLRAIERRRSFKGYLDGCRIFYGTSDGLPGLIIDLFKNAAVIQINTAGIDRHRELIAATVSSELGRLAFFLDNPKYREKEGLPQFPKADLPALEAVENGLRYELRSEVIQKVGFYYDHRENRRALGGILGRLERLPTRGLDLFSYVGAWGQTALDAGVPHVDFVDQGDFASEITRALELNSFGSRGEFHRADVFRFLEESQKSYDLVMCDPPAFAKSPTQKSQALDGYSKLHRRVLRVISQGGIVAFSSCTHYVSHEEFQKNVLDAAHREGKKLQLLFSGLQGWDHPVSSLQEKSNYIKSYIYRTESA